MDRVGQRFFAVDVLAQVERGVCNHGMGMIGRADDDGVDLAMQLIKHPSEVVDRSWPGDSAWRPLPGDSHPRRKGQRCSARPGEVLVIVRAAAAYPHQGDVERLGEVTAMQHGRHRDGTDRRARHHGGEAATAHWTRGN